MAQLPDRTDDEWDRAWQTDGDGLAGMGDNAPAAAPEISPSWLTEIQRAIDPAEPEPEPQPPPQLELESDPGLAGWEELRRQRRGRELQEDIEAPYAPDIGGTWLGRDLQESGWFDRQIALHRGERERVREEAIRGSEAAARYGGGGGELYPGQADATRPLTDFITEAPRWARAAGTVTPGGIVSGAGTALQQPDVIIAQAEYRSQDWRVWQLQAAEALDEGEDIRTVLRIVGPQRLRRRDGSTIPSAQADLFMNWAITYSAMPAGQRRQERERVQAEFNAFNPTPIGERPLYRTGEQVQEIGRTLHTRFGVPLPEGYDDNSFAVQFGRGLGSMISGMLVRAPLNRLFGPAAGTAGAGAFFGAMGGGEATQRAVEFDRAERAAGRPGLTQQDIILAGLWGIGPGTTDIAPIEVLLRGLPFRMPGALRTAIAWSIGRIGGQVFIEAFQEGGQEFLQNFIAAHVYNPNQNLLQNVAPSAAVGGAVGGTVSTAQEILALFIPGRRGRLRGPGGQPPSGQPPSPEVTPAAAPPPFDAAAAAAREAARAEAVRARSGPCFGWGV